MKPTLKTLLLILSITLVNCKKEDRFPPEISTLEVTEITATTAVINIELEDYWKGLSTIVLVSNNQNWVDDENYFFAALPGNPMLVIMSDLTPNTKYYVTAYVVADYVIGKVLHVTSYWKQIEFTTFAE